MQPWRDWYHINGNTYGTWLPGDPRGFRTRHHHEHIEGDYKNPPPTGAHDARLARSRSLMRRHQAHLSRAARRLACDTMANALVSRGIELVALCVDDHHFHMLARFPNRDQRRWVGAAKAISARALSKSGLAEEGGVWAVRSRCWPIKDRAHQLATAWYILVHHQRGAAVLGINEL